MAKTLINDTPIRGEALSEPIYWLGSQWAVTSYGVETRDGTYCIEKARLHEAYDNGWTWEKHMAGKNWADSFDLARALAVARKRWPKRALSA